MEAESVIEEEEEEDDPELHPRCGGVNSMAELESSPSVGGGIVIADGSDGGG